MHRIPAFTVSALVVALTLVGCALGRTQHSIERPWKGLCDVAGPTAIGTPTTLTGSCDFGAIGRLPLTAVHTVTRTGADFSFVSTVTYTGTNSDQLMTANSGTATVVNSVATIVGTETAVGGTGQFKGVTGTAVLTGSVRFTGASGVGKWLIDGRLKF